MSRAEAKLYEHATITFEVKLESGHGTLPSICDNCKGALDFVRVDNKTVLKCRDCGKEYE